MSPIFSFFITLFNMIKRALAPIVQPQRLFAALMVIGGRSATTSATTTCGNGSTASSSSQSPPSTPLLSSKSSTITSNKTKSAIPSSQLYIPKKSTLDSRQIGNYSREYSTSSSSSSKRPIFNDTYLNDLFWQLSSQGPAFEVNPNNIDFIQEPIDFYNHLIDGVKRSKKRITMASLYLGTGKQEIELVKEMKLAMERNKELKIHILLDGLRGTRIGVDKESSATILDELLNLYSDRVTISMYHTPDLNGILKKVLPPRINETIGVQHIKTYVFDDDLLLSGANLSKDYFTNRQDRYILIRATKSVSNYFNEIVGIIGSLSLHVDKNNKNQLLLSSGSINPVTQSNEFKNLAYTKLSTLLKSHTYYPSNDGSNGKSIDSPFDCKNNNNNNEEETTWIFPTIQMGPFNIRQDEVVTSHIFESVPSDSKFFITSPYFNLTENYLNLILTGKPKLDIITCSPQANGFYGSKGLSSAVPDCYAIIEKRFLQRVQDTDNGERISVQEYIRDKWTYHAKGLWIQVKNQQHPSITLIGSPNFGSRSVEKDLEAQIILITQNKQLQQKMDNEKNYLWTYTQDANLELFEKRKVSLMVRFLVYIFGNYL
ncbi:hypothetical protein ACTFIU_005575 [Dictyostelium citrinum]